MHSPHHIPDAATDILERFSPGGRGIGLTETLLPLAGVLLGKTRPNSVYGLIGGLPETVPQF